MGEDDAGVPVDVDVVIGVAGSTIGDIPPFALLATDIAEDCFRLATGFGARLRGFFLVEGEPDSEAVVSSFAIGDAVLVPEEALMDPEVMIVGESDLVLRRGAARGRADGADVGVSF